MGKGREETHDRSNIHHLRNRLPLTLQLLPLHIQRNIQLSGPTSSSGSSAALRTGQLLPHGGQLAADAVDLGGLDRVNGFGLEEGADEGADGVVGGVGLRVAEEGVDVVCDCG